MFVTVDTETRFMEWRRIKGKLWSGWFTLRGKINPSFSQAGEDRIMHYLFAHYLGKERLSYLDIGANHPVLFNNTYLFYIKGGRGVCVEPDPALYGILKKYRKRDVILDAGVGFGAEKSGEFYVFKGKESAWNTFSKVEAEKRKEQSGKEYNIIQRNLIDVNTIISDYFNETPDILSIDAEGIDEQIICSLDLEKYKPNVICVETVEFSLSSAPKSGSGISGHLLANGYRVFADTHINTIYCRSDLLS